jgi:hypothetical protein
MKARYVVAGLLGMLLGCGRVMTVEDCSQIKDNMAVAWATAAGGALDPDASVPERARIVVAAEGQNLVTEWMATCKEELVGRRVDPQELRCTLRARTLAAISKCAEP